MITDFDKAMAVLTEGQIDFIVIGGVAGSLHGSGFITQDLDGRVPTALPPRAQSIGVRSIPAMQIAEPRFATLAVGEAPIATRQQGDASLRRDHENLCEAVLHRVHGVE